MFVGLGGFCTSGRIDRDLELNKFALPFDFIRSKFYGVNELIKNDFLEFLPEKGTSPDDIRGEGGELTIYFRNTHTFYHHNLLDNNIYEAFNRRINRFINLLNNEKEIIFYRVITSQFISDEINLRENFYNTLKIKYSNLNFKIIFIGFVKNNTPIENVYYKKLDETACIFYITVNNNSDHITPYSASCIKFFIQNGLLDKKIQININDFTYEDFDFEEKTQNEIFLDNYV
jgi:hypothetical protein